MNALPQFTQITRHICIEGWSAIGKFTGIRFSDFLRAIGADLNAKYVTFRCDDRYVTSIDMGSDLHLQTQLTLGFDGGPLPREHGFPLKLRIPTKLGFKNPMKFPACLGFLRQGPPSDKHETSRPVQPLLSRQSKRLSSLSESGGGGEG